MCMSRPRWLTSSPAPRRRLRAVRQVRSLRAGSTRTARSFCTEWPAAPSRPGARRCRCGSHTAAPPGSQPGSAIPAASPPRSRCPRRAPAFPALLYSGFPWSARATQHSCRTAPPRSTGFLAAVASPALRAAPYRMFEGLPGIQNLGPVLEEESVVVVPGGIDFGAKSASQAGSVQRHLEHTVLSYVVYATTGIVNSRRATPPPPAADGHLAPGQLAATGRGRSAPGGSAYSRRR